MPVETLMRKYTAPPDFEAATRRETWELTNTVPDRALKLNRRDFLNASAAGDADEYSRWLLTEVAPTTAQSTTGGAPDYAR